MFNKNYIVNKAILIYIIISFLGQTVNVIVIMMFIGSLFLKGL